MPRQAYTCEHCEFTGSIDVVRQHESTCVYNPILRTCITCAKYINKTYDPWMCPNTLQFITGSNIMYNCRDWEYSKVKYK